MEFISYYPWIISYKFEMDKIYNENAIQYCKDLQKNKKSVYLTNRGGWQSPHFFKKNAEGTPLEIYLIKLEKILSIVYKKVGFKNIELNNIWININQKNHYNIQHTHGSLPMSGVFYLTENNSNITFYFKNKKFLSLSSVKHQIFFFPGCLPHGVEPANSERISIAFNCVNRSINLNKLDAYEKAF